MMKPGVEMGPGDGPGMGKGYLFYKSIGMNGPKRYGFRAVLVRNMVQILK